MATTTKYINSFTYDNVEYKLVDNSSGYTKNTGTVTAVTASGALTSSGGTAPAITHNKPSTSPAKTTQAVYEIKIDEYGHITAAGSAVTIPSEVTESTVSGWGFTKNAGTVTSVTASGALTSSGGTTPAITHNKPSTSPAKTTQALYPIKIDEYGHITAVGTAVTSLTPASHSHGNISNTGTITSTAITPSGTANAEDYILLSDGSNSGKIERGIKIGTGTSKYLREDGTWQSVSTSDVKQNVTLATTTKTYLTGVTTAPTSTAQALEAYGDTGVYLTEEAGQINATSYRINENAEIVWNDNDGSIDFVFYEVLS